MRECLQSVEALKLKKVKLSASPFYGHFLLSNLSIVITPNMNYASSDFTNN